MGTILDYKQSFTISCDDPSFAAIIWAAMRKADSYNMELLHEAFPALYSEFVQRYNAPGGAIDAAELRWLEGK